MRVRCLVAFAAVLAVAIPAQARAGTFAGIVVAKQPQRGTLLLVRPDGMGLTVRGGLARVVVGDRVTVSGTTLRGATLRLTALHVVGHMRSAHMRATVVRHLAAGTLVASARSVILIRGSGRRLSSALDRGDLRSGEVADFRIRFEDDEIVEEAPPVQVGQASVVRLEGAIVSVSPFVVSLEGLPLTITVPAGMTLPAGLAAGQRIELTVQVGATNAFTLVAIDEIENANAAVAAQEVEVKGFVVSSTTAQIVVNANGTTFTFVAPAGTTLPVLATGTFVEVRGLRQNGTTTVTRLRVEDNDGGGSGGGGGDDGGHGGSGGGGGDDGGGGH
jgi:hypothetical protein